MLFEEFGLDDRLMEAISYMGFEKATPIQISTIPEILAGNDLIACAQTGTGKSAAFLLPVLNKLKDEERKGINTLVIVPTRELAIQIYQQIQGFAYFVPVSSIAIYGGGDGSNWDQEKQVLTKGADIVVATPGKLLSHIKMGYVDFSAVEHLILDEADRMLDIGFHDDIMSIISNIPKERQTLMFSATMAPRIRALAGKILTEPVEVSTAIAKPADGILQAAYLAHDNQKIPLIESLIRDKPEYASILIFSSTKKKVFDIVRSLKKLKGGVEGISSDLTQKEREEVLQRFKSRQTRILVATDVLSRGIDIKDINLIINFDVPKEAADYVHRVGRTARADQTGVALTIINEDDMFSFHRIEELIESNVMKLQLPEGLGEGPLWNPKAKFKRSRYRGKKYQKKPSKKFNGNRSPQRNRK
ncbi:MAG: DEAD/DEAH box helicase [Bacteroidales bacterium]|nr:DEAD/DEAH box helicase [Bacteroidales bacterium]